MSKKTFPSDILAQAQDALTAWNQISPTLAFGTLNVAAMTADITAVTAFDNDIARLETQLIDKRNQREIVCLGMWDKVKRFRSGVKANYGDDSSQYEMVGGTRASDRKSPTRKTAA